MCGVECDAAEEDDAVDAVDAVELVEVVLLGEDEAFEEETAAVSEFSVLFFLSSDFLIEP